MDGQISFLKYYRIRQGLDQSELGARVNMRQSAIARAERLGGMSNMRATTLQKLAKALDVRMEDLLR
jgi:transcriptional regulator with XRE-family HTH domain